MKFKVLFVIFNIVLFLSFLTIFLLPFFILDASFMLEFWSKNWYFGAIFLVILGVVNFAFPRELENAVVSRAGGLAGPFPLPRGRGVREGAVLRSARCSCCAIPSCCSAISRRSGNCRTCSPRKSRPCSERSRRQVFGSPPSCRGLRVDVRALGTKHEASAGTDRDWMNFLRRFFPAHVEEATTNRRR